MGYTSVDILAREGDQYLIAGNGRVIVQPDADDSTVGRERTKFVWSDIYDRPAHTGTVKQVGNPICKKNTKTGKWDWIYSNLKTGDRIWYKWASGTYIKIDNIKYLIIDFKDILSLIGEDNE